MGWLASSKGSQDPERVVEACKWRAAHALRATTLLYADAIQGLARERSTRGYRPVPVPRILGHDRVRWADKGWGFGISSEPRPWENPATWLRATAAGTACAHQRTNNNQGKVYRHQRRQPSSSLSAGLPAAADSLASYIAWWWMARPVGSFFSLSGNEQCGAKGGGAILAYYVAAMSNREVRFVNRARKGERRRGGF